MLGHPVAVQYSPLEIGLISTPRIGTVARFARLAEQLGFASLAFTDSQTLQPDVWGQLFLAARATQRISIGTGVTNPVTRDCSVTASALAALHAESSGRAFCGIGRGASAAEKIGLKPATANEFDRYLDRLSRYLGGTVVTDRGVSSRLEWIPDMDWEKPPIEVAATGPRVIDIAAKHADRIAFCVGAGSNRIESALKLARAAAEKHGRDPDKILYGAYINCVVDDDIRAARDAVRGSLSTFALTNVRNDLLIDSLPPTLRDAAKRLRANFDLDSSMQSSAAHARELPDEFIDWFGIVGSADKVQSRFEELATLGIDYVSVSAGSPDMPQGVAAATLMTLSRRIIPAVQKC